ncbi:hypothetical protein QQM79_15695 [Marinobacteraceae bacterium S3BR75-40.1]
MLVASVWIAAYALQILAAGQALTRLWEAPLHWAPVPFFLAGPGVHVLYYGRQLKLTRPVKRWVYVEMAGLSLLAVIVLILAFVPES